MNMSHFLPCLSFIFMVIFQLSLLQTFYGVSSSQLTEFDILKQCKLSFDYFASNNRRDKGIIDNGVEGYHKSIIHSHYEWFVNKNGVSTNNTLFECCEPFVDAAKVQLFADSKDDLQLKIRQMGHIYSLYIKDLGFKFTQTSWFDVIQYYHHEDRNLSIIKIVMSANQTKPLQSVLRSPLQSFSGSESTSTVSFDPDIIQELERQEIKFQRKKNSKISECFDNILLIRKLERKGIISRHNKGNCYYGSLSSKKRIYYSNKPSDAVVLALNQPIPKFIGFDTINMYYQTNIKDPANLAAILSNQTCLDSSYKGVSVTSSFWLASYLYGTHLLYTDYNSSDQWFYSITLQLNVMQNKVTECRTSCVSDHDIFKEIPSNSLKKIGSAICKQKYVQIVALIVKRYELSEMEMS